MKQKTLFIAFAAAAALSSCKKNYTCACTNPGGTQDVFTVKDTKSNADTKCSDYYDTTYGNIPMNETSCAIKE